MQGLDLHHVLNLDYPNLLNKNQQESVCNKINFICCLLEELLYLKYLPHVICLLYEVKFQIILKIVQMKLLTYVYFVIIPLCGLIKFDFEF
jgi:hypothetical protein